LLFSPKIKAWQGLFLSRKEGGYQLEDYIKLKDPPPFCSNACRVKKSNKSYSLHLTKKGPSLRSAPFTEYKEKISYSACVVSFDFWGVPTQL